ncbi:P-loop NTPase fold protein [Pantoea ananatis]|uniref:P-loop NTPase fold protein n=1 Tax=Pantoea ananas TaxID=553 RepID=UPI00234FCD74|nr:P-loop NTPase fold protein [Pantoea ananatis]
MIGIEGKWGAGKTSLLRLLMNKLEDLKPDGTYVLHLAPWLRANSMSPVDSLLLPVAAILREEEERRQPRPHVISGRNSNGASGGAGTPARRWTCKTISGRPPGDLRLWQSLPATSFQSSGWPQRVWRRLRSLIYRADSRLQVTCTPALIKKSGCLT